jgi:hypothetical protein
MPSAKAAKTALHTLKAGKHTQVKQSQETMSRTALRPWLVVICTAFHPKQDLIGLLQLCEKFDFSIPAVKLLADLETPRLGSQQATEVRHDSQRRKRTPDNMRPQLRRYSRRTEVI